MVQILTHAKFKLGNRHTRASARTANARAECSARVRLTSELIRAFGEFPVRGSTMCVFSFGKVIWLLVDGQIVLKL